MNVAVKQLDYLSAGVMDSFNLFTGEVEQENKFLERIRSKVKILQIYSNSPANDIYYFGNSFESTDYVDFSKTEDRTELAVFENGRAILPISNIKPWISTQVIINSESNGFSGNNHAVYLDDDVDSTYRYYFKDNPTSRLKENVRDKNPLTIFEYEQIHISQEQKNEKGALDYEFKYSNNSSLNQSTEYIDWSTFPNNGADDLILSMTLQSQNPSNANFVEVIPYFGNDEMLTRDVIIDSVEVTDYLDNVENIIKNPITISSSFIPTSASNIDSFFYKKANLKFSERKVKSIKIIFRQKNISNIKLKHVYFSPDSAANNPYKNQLRFDSNSPSIPEELNFPEIPWNKPVSFSVTQIVPAVSQPNIFKSDVANTNYVDVNLQRNIPTITGKCVKVKASDGSFVRITRRFFTEFDVVTKDLINYNSISNTSTEYQASTYFTGLSPTSDQSNRESAFIARLGQSDSILTDIVNWLNDPTNKQARRTKFNLDLLESAVIEESVNSIDTVIQNKSYKVPVVRQYEIYDAQRKAICLRDITVGYEEYDSRAVVVSRKYDVPSDIEFLTLSSEVDFFGNTLQNLSDYLEYYISVNDGRDWIRIETIQNPFSGNPEVIAFNQNIEKRFQLPGVEYYNYPVVPSSVRSFRVKIVLKKPINENVTPAVYSYNVGVKVRQI